MGFLEPQSTQSKLPGEVKFELGTTHDFYVYIDILVSKELRASFSIFEAVIRAGGIELDLEICCITL